VLTILKDYSTAEKAVRPKRSGSAEADIFEEVISGIKVYFDRCLGNILLYRFERQQYIDIRRRNDSQEPSEIYGAEHLLRLFGARMRFNYGLTIVSLPGLIAHTTMDQQSVTTLKDHIEGVLKLTPLKPRFFNIRYIAKHRDELFEKNYEATSAQYQREPL
jgi:mortality factor 4-like protein 1